MASVTGAHVRTAEDDELEEAAEILAELKRKADAGENDLAWGDCVDRIWDEKGMLRVTREYSVAPGLAPLRIREMPYSAHPDAVGGTGGVVWKGALALVEMLRGDGMREAMGSARTLLEIGAGCGLPGLCAAAGELIRPEAVVYITDEAGPVVDNLQYNVEQNAARFRASVQVHPLTWEDVLDGKVTPPEEHVDLLLGSDVIWGERGPIVARLARRLVKHDGGCFALTAEVGREGLDAFEALLKAPEDAQSGALGPPFIVELSRTKVPVDDGFEEILQYWCKRN
eukprot:TRINITY_DN42800_c0_g1_i1.p1 TRINITY_DN42800_c0_g1~~TRINITY_DN42800_c0_g1_i1.p1  ORF type:complete len:284 (+),score=49.81 TRINITY_DN42800_c0_g1_i1:134-985(+)